MIHIVAWAKTRYEDICTFGYGYEVINTHVGMKERMRKSVEMVDGGGGGGEG